jgi:hypothetical protein
MRSSFEIKIYFMVVIAIVLSLIPLSKLYGTAKFRIRNETVVRFSVFNSRNGSTSKDKTLRVWTDSLNADIQKKKTNLSLQSTNISHLSIWTASLEKGARVESKMDYKSVETNSKQTGEKIDCNIRLKSIENNSPTRGLGVTSFDGLKAIFRNDSNGTLIVLGDSQMKPVHSILLAKLGSCESLIAQVDDRCGGLMKYIGLKPKNMSRRVKPDPSMLEGPVAYGRNNPGCTDMKSGR